MTWWEALVLGIVEGLTEYLPVSSTGHLLLAQRALGIPESDAANAYAICIQGGAILAVVGLYFRRVRQMACGVFGKDRAGLDLAARIALAFLPAAVIGLLLQDWIKLYLFAGDRWGLWPTVAAWFVGGVAILAVSWYGRWRQTERGQGLGIEAITWRMALVIGLFQCIAMWPGVSRSLATIVGGVIAGLSLGAAVEFSFLLGALTLTAATLYDGVKYGTVMLEEIGPGAIVIGFVAAWASAVLAVRWMVAYLGRHGLEVFGYYRIALAIVVAILIAANYV